MVTFKSPYPGSRVILPSLKPAVFENGEYSTVDPAEIKFLDGVSSIWRVVPEQKPSGITVPGTVS